MSLITFAQATAQVRRGDLVEGSPLDAEAADLVQKMAAAEAIILDYLKVTTAPGSPPAWDETTVPEVVRAAVLLQLAELYRFRGDEAAGAAQTAGDLSPVITNLLRRYRDPALA
ncbi:MAG TPA: head-tail connector protein [Phycisphaerae bacterium]|nr:head-tail connector protein [Phycisphaerae bacterium]